MPYDRKSNWDELYTAISTFGKHNQPQEVLTFLRAATDVLSTEPGINECPWVRKPQMVFLPACSQFWTPSKTHSFCGFQV